MKTIGVRFILTKEEEKQLENRIPKHLKRLKYREGVSNKKMAEICEKSVIAYRKYESGEVPIPHKVLEKIEAHFGVTIVMAIAGMEKEKKVSYGKDAAAELAKWARENMRDGQIFDLIMSLSIAQKVNLTKGENNES